LAAGAVLAVGEVLLLAAGVGEPDGSGLAAMTMAAPLATIPTARMPAAANRLTLDMVPSGAGGSGVAIGAVEKGCGQFDMGSTSE
jgi:hypothetical protein